MPSDPPQLDWHRWLPGQLKWLLYILSAGAMVVLVVLGAGRIPSVTLGLLLAVYLTVLGIWRWRRRIRRDRERWRDVMPCYLSVQNRDLRIIETNELFRRDFGEALGQHCYRAYKDRDKPCPDCPVLKTFTDGQIHRGEETVVTKRGETAQVMITSTPIHDVQGRFHSVMEMSTNITELKSLQHELDRSRQYFQQLFDIVPCYITVQDREFHIIESNQLFRQDFGERIGAHCFCTYKNFDHICTDCPVERTFADGEIHSSEETVTMQDGRQANVIVYSMPVRDEQGAIKAVMEVSTNITEVKRLQHQLAMMGLAVAGMAHRIKNILMGLEGGTFVVNTGFELNEQRTVDEGWQMVQRNVAKISRLVKDLLFCSKERTPAFKDNVSVHAIIREVFELYRKRATNDGIELRLDLESTEVLGTFDPEGLHNLVTNLTANAIDACRFDPDYTNKQHEISIRCRRQEDGATRIEVSDNGPGIPRDLHDKVFAGFFSTKGTEGTGLGLLVVQKVAQEHGGSVSFTSNHGQGATFTVILPQRDERKRSAESGAR